MKKNNNKVLSLIIGMVAIVFALVSCKSGSESNEANADSIQTKITSDSMMKMTETHDTAQKVMDMTVKARPNPAKKHGKGMIVFQTNWEKQYEQQSANMAIEMDKEGIYKRTETRPSYPGGESALAKFIQENIVYPETALDNGVEGTVDVVFAVDENGKVYTPRINGDKQGYGLDESSLDVVNKMPKWNPGQIKGKNVKSYYTLPISFRIN